MKCHILDLSGFHNNQGVLIYVPDMMLIIIATIGPPPGAPIDCTVRFGVKLTRTTLRTFILYSFKSSSEMMPNKNVMNRRRQSSGKNVPKLRRQRVEKFQCPIDVRHNQKNRSI